MGPRVVDSLDQFLNDVRRRREVGITHTEIDDIRTRRSRRSLHGVDFSENVWRQPPNAVKIGLHGSCPVGVDMKTAQGRKQRDCRRRPFNAWNLAVRGSFRLNLLEDVNLRAPVTRFARRHGFGIDRPIVRNRFHNHALRRHPGANQRLCDGIRTVK